MKWVKSAVITNEAVKKRTITYCSKLRCSLKNDNSDSTEQSGRKRSASGSRDSPHPKQRKAAVISSPPEVKAKNDNDLCIQEKPEQSKTVGTFSASHNEDEDTEVDEDKMSVEGDCKLSKPGGDSSESEESTDESDVNKEGSSASESDGDSDSSKSSTASLK